MQPIIMLAIAGIAVAAVGVGFLGNTITLTVQQLGVGEQDLSSPISEATVDFVIARTSGVVGLSTQTHDVIQKCTIFADRDIVADSKVFCKLTDANGNVVAEGVTELPFQVNSHTPLMIPISTADFPANRVQNIHDVVLVVQGP